MAATQEAAIYDVLVNDGTLGALVGGTGVGARVYLDTVPQSAELDYVWVQRISWPQYHSCLDRSRYEEAHYQIDVVALTRVRRRALVDAVVGALDHLGMGQTVQSIQFAGVVFEGGSDSFIPERDGSDEGRFVTRLDFAAYSHR